MSFIKQTRLAVFYLVNIKGLTPEGFIVYDVDFWHTKTDYNSQKKPALRNTFLLQPTGKATTDYEALMIQTIESYIVRASLRGEKGDQRDLRLILTQPKDNRSVLNNAGVRAMKNRKIERS